MKTSYKANNTLMMKSIINMLDSFAANLFNRLPKVIRNEKSLTKFNLLLKEFL